jgi:hypothetical protein
LRAVQRTRQGHCEFEAIRLNPNFAEAYAVRHKAWSAKVDKAKAEADFKEAKRLGPNVDLEKE